jgi:hypothetical protein
MMVCLKNLLPYAPSLAKIAASRLMFIIGFRFAVSRAKRCFATLARKCTAFPAKRAAKRLVLEAIAQKNVLNVRQLIPVKRAARNTKSKIISIEIIARIAVATCTKRNCILVATTWLRLKEMVTSAVSAKPNNRLMYTTSTCLGGLRKLSVKGAITT